MSEQRHGHPTGAELSPEEDARLERVTGVTDPAEKQRLVERARSGPDEVSRTFARTEMWGTRIGVTAVLVAFALYVSGVLPPYVPVAHLINVVAEDARAFAAHTGHPTGLSWVFALGHGDVLALGSLALLTSVIVFCYIAILPALIRQRDIIYIFLIVTQLAVFALAVFGGFGGH